MTPFVSVAGDCWASSALVLSTIDTVAEPVKEELSASSRKPKIPQRERSSRRLRPRLS